MIPERKPVSRKRLLLLGLSLLAAAVEGWAQAPNTAAGSGSGAAAATTTPVEPPPVTAGGLPSIIIAPPNQPHDETLGRGCWVRFFDDKSYGGRSLTLIGPVDMPKMNIPGGLWINWSSALVGPSATVTTFDYEQFQNRTAVLRAGQRIPNLADRKLGLFEDIHSVRIVCKA